MKCPGQDTQYWKPGAIYEVKCPKCEKPVEFFKDDTARKCNHCGHRFVNPNMDFGCAAYCQYAEQCLGTLPEELLAQKEDLLKDRVAIEMKRYFKSDFKRIGRSGRAARYAERIAKKEEGMLPVILCAAYLRDIGAVEAERKHGEVTAEHLEQESPLVARSILVFLKAKEELIEAVCDIVGDHRPPEDGDDLNRKVVFEGALIADLEDRQKETPLAAEEIEAVIAQRFFTNSGKQEARKVLLK
ncbi:MAG: phosphohydrolase [Deltaproteobacteria bacterium SG8_13]|nr:MAG: phosphohydrolase [Deltaproteobacteria bacterium SG8_13]